MRKNNISTGQKGTAKLADRGEFGSFDQADDLCKHFFIGYHPEFDNNGKPKDIFAEIDSHLLTVGATRSGKGVSQIIPNLLITECPVVVIDPKGENAWITAQRRRELGQKVVVVDPFGEVNSRYYSEDTKPEVISKYNPLDSLNPEDPNYVDGLRYLANSLIVREGKEPHWDESAFILVTGLIAYVVENKKEKKSLPRVKEILSDGLRKISSIADDIVATNGGFGDNSIAKRKLARYADLSIENDNREEMGIISTALRQLDFLDCPTLSKSLCSSDFSFDELTQGGQSLSVYLVLPTNKLDTYSRWLRLMVSMALLAVSNNKKPVNKHPVTFFLDEFGSIGPLPAIAQAVGLMAGQGVRLWIFVQSLVQLERDYPLDWENFIANSCVITVLKVMDNTTAKYVSDLLGETTLETENGKTYLQQTTGMPLMLEKNDRASNHGSSSSTSNSRPLIQPSELRRMPTPLGIVITDGNPAMFMKARYHQDSRISCLARRNPCYPEDTNKKEE